MTAKNDITGDTIASAPFTAQGRENYDRIFRKSCKHETPLDYACSDCDAEFELNKETDITAEEIREDIGTKLNNYEKTFRAKNFSDNLLDQIINKHQNHNEH